MNRRRIQIIILSILIMLTLGFIWGNSMLGAEKSSEISHAVSKIVDKILNLIFPEHAVSIDDGQDSLIRKLAHFTEFLVLGIELTSLIRYILAGNPVIPLFCGLLAALCDETIQIFSEGRGSQVSDVWIDFCGVITGFLFVSLFILIKNHRNKNNFKHYA